MDESLGYQLSSKNETFFCGELARNSWLLMQDSKARGLERMRDAVSVTKVMKQYAMLSLNVARQRAYGQLANLRIS